MLTATNPTTIGELQFALWGVFDPKAISYITNYNSTWGAAAQAWLNQAGAQAYTSGEFSNFLVYIPVGNYVCNGRNCSTTPPQEFLTMTVPEGGAAMVYLLTAGLACFGAMFWRRKDCTTVV
jgi:hypothetical protein